MKNLSLLKVRISVMSSILFGFFFLAQIADGATIYQCAASGKRCAAKLEAGSVGDRVKITDVKARTIARGRIIVRKGEYAIIAITHKPSKTIRRGFPVIVEVDTDDSALEWAATFSYRD